MTARNVWREDKIPPRAVAVQGDDKTISLGWGRKYFGRSRLAALSPDCATALIATECWIKLFQLDLNNASASKASTLPIDEVEDAALTNDTLVVLTRTALKIYPYKHARSTITATWWQDYPHGIANPICIAVHGPSWDTGVRFVVGGSGISGPEVHLAQIQYDNAGPLDIVPCHTYTCSPINSPKSIAFCGAGKTILMVTEHSSCTLVWHIMEDRNGDIVPKQAIVISAPGDVGIFE